MLASYFVLVLIGRLTAHKKYSCLIVSNSSPSNFSRVKLTIVDRPVMPPGPIIPIIVLEARPHSASRASNNITCAHCKGVYLVGIDEGAFIQSH